MGDAGQISDLERRLAATAEERDEARERADWAEQRIRELEGECLGMLTALQNAKSPPG